MNENVKRCMPQNALMGAATESNRESRGILLSLMDTWSDDISRSGKQDCAIKTSVQTFTSVVNVSPDAKRLRFLHSTAVFSPRSQQLSDEATDPWSWLMMTKTAISRSDQITVQPHVNYDYNNHIIAVSCMSKDTNTHVCHYHVTHTLLTILWVPWHN